MTSHHRFSTGAIEEALTRSPFAALPPALLQVLTQDALPVDLPAGSLVYSEADQPRCGLVVTGLIRVYMTSPDGRQITVRYTRTGDLLGIATVLGGPAPTSVQILTNSTLLLFNSRTVERLGQTEAKVGWLLAQEVT